MNGVRFTGDQKLLLGVAVVIITITVGVFSLSPKGGENGGIASTYNSGSGGTKAAYLLLGDLGYHIERWMSPPSQLPTNPHGHTLILTDPMFQFESGDLPSLRSFVEGGGTLIAAGGFTSIIAPDVHIEQAQVGAVRIDSNCDATSQSLSAHATAEIIRVGAAQVWAGKSPLDDVLYRCGQNAVVVEYPLGQGRVIWLSSARPFTNAGLREVGNLQFLLDLVGRPGDDQILWDEHFHGTERSLYSLVADTPLKILGAQLLLALFATCLGYSRRSGPIQPLPVAPRTAPIEFVETLGSLYKQAQAANVAVEVAYERFMRTLRERIGAAQDLSLREIVAVAERRLHYESHDLLRDLVLAQDAKSDPFTTDQQALEIVRRLHHHADRLKLFRVSTASSDTRKPTTDGALPSRTV